MRCNGESVNQTVFLQMLLDGFGVGDGGVLDEGDIATLDGTTQRQGIRLLIGLSAQPVF